MWLFYRVMSPNDADGMVNSVDPDQTQTAPRGAVWSGSTLFAIPSALFRYRYFPKFSDGQAWANSADPDQTHYSMVEPHSSNFRVITTKFLGVPIFRKFTVNPKIKKCLQRMYIYQLSPVKRICVFEHSVMTNFNCACPDIQRGQGSGFLSEGSSWLTACMSEQRRFWRDCANAHARLNLRCSHRW